MAPKLFIKRLLQRGGLDVVRFNARSSPLARRIKLFRHFEINLVLDVGASTGGYAQELRSTGYAGRIVSFEPSTEAFGVLQQQAARDPAWSAVQMALGNKPGSATLHLSRNRESSSFLRIRSRHTNAYPAASYVATEKVSIRRLDDVFANYHTGDFRTFLKIDTQGFEQQVLQGGQASLPQIVGVQVELSLVSLYDGETPFMDLIKQLQGHGFTLMSFQPVIDDPETGQLLQVDGLFFRDDS